MSEFTQNKNLLKADDEFGLNESLVKLNGNWDIIDTELGNLTDTAMSINAYKSYKNGNDWTPAFTAAFNYLTSVGGGRVLVPEGIYQAIVKIPAHCGVEGIGEKSIIQSPPNATEHCVQNLSEAKFVTIRNLTIDGNKGNQTNTVHGLYLYSSQTATSDTSYYSLNDSFFNIQNVKIINCKGNGLHVDGRGESIFTSIHSLNNDGDGVYVNCPDSMFNSISSGQNYGHGFTITAGNNRFVNCKGWNNGLNNSSLTTGYGFYLYGCMNVYVQGEAQGNLLDGVYMYQAQLCTVDVFNDANGQNSGINSNGVSGFTLNNCVYNTIRGNVRNRKDRSQNKINYIVSLLGVCSDNIIDAQGLDIAIGALYDAGTNLLNNLVKLRGNDLTSAKFETTTSLKTITVDLTTVTTWQQAIGKIPIGGVVSISPDKLNSALLPNSGAYYGSMTINVPAGGKISAILISWDSTNLVPMGYIGVWNNSTSQMVWKKMTVS